MCGKEERKPLDYLGVQQGRFYVRKGLQKDGEILVERQKTEKFYIKVFHLSCSLKATFLKCQIQILYCEKSSYLHRMLQPEAAEARARAQFSYYKNVMVKVSPLQATKAHGRCGCKGLHIHSHGIRMRQNGQSYARPPLPPGKFPGTHFIGC